MDIEALFQICREGLKFQIKLTPKASKDKIDRLEAASDGTVRLRVTVTAVPEKGKANIVLVKLLAKKLGLSKGKIKIIAGEHARLKTVLVIGEGETLKPDLTAVLKSLGIQ